jgi:hypothetical protein
VDNAKFASGQDREEQSWVLLITLTPPAAASQLAIEEARLTRRLMASNLTAGEAGISVVPVQAFPRSCTLSFRDLIPRLPAGVFFSAERTHPSPPVAP